MSSSKSCLEGEKITHPTDTTINKMLEDLLDNKPDIHEAVALINADDNKTVTYKELNETANVLARLLVTNIKEHSLKPNSEGDYIVALRFHPGPELIATMLAIFKAGLAYVPIAPSWPEGRIQQIMCDAAPVMLISNMEEDIVDSAQKNISFEERKTVFQYSNLIGEASKSNTPKGNLPREMSINSNQEGSTLFAVLYTSGSTGVPKGVRHSHSAALNRFYWQWRTFPYEEGEVCIFKTTPVFIDSVIEIWSPLLSGKKVVIVPTNVTQNVEKFVANLEQYKIRRVFAVTSLVRNILAFLKLSDSNKGKLSCVKIWECTGEVLTKDVLLDYFDLFKAGDRVSNLYDSTEMIGGVYTTFMNSDDVQAALIGNKVPIGVPVDNTKAYILDDNMEPVTEGATGSLYISGRNLAKGYVGGNNERFMMNYLQGKEEMNQDYDVLYKTGDFASIQQGRIYYEGRLDSQIKVRGHRVDLAEIEKAVYEVKGVTKASIICFKPGEQTQKVLCYFTCHQDNLVSDADVEQNLKRTLPSYMIPKIFKLDSMPVLVSGKTDRQALIAKYEKSQSFTPFTFKDADVTGYGVKVTRYEVAKIVLGSVGGVIQDSAHKPTLCDNFFDIGGDSINMVVVIRQLTEHGYNINITDFLSATNLANVVAKVSTKPRGEDLPRLESTGYCSEKLQAGHNEVVINLISRSFADKEPLVTLVGASYQDMKENLEASWESYIQENLSLVVKNESGEVIGACLNLDARFTPPTPPTPTPATPLLQSKLAEIIIPFLDAIEKPVLETHIPCEKGYFIHTCLLGTAKHLTAIENVEVTLLIEQHLIRMGQNRHFQGILTTNTNKLTQMIGKDLGYEVITTIQINEYEDLHGARPFSSATNDQMVEVAIKRF